MVGRTTLRLAGALGATLVFGLTACGDQPTANRDFYAIATHSSRMEVLPQPVGFPVPIVHDVLSGHLVDASRRPVANSSFYEDCAYGLSSKKLRLRPTTCTVVIKTGPKTYVARGFGEQVSGGVAGYYYGMLGSLGSGGAIGPGSAVTWILPDGSGTTPYKMKISIRVWGSPPFSASYSAPEGSSVR